MPLLAFLILGGIAQYFFPWWSIAIVAFIVGAVQFTHAGKSFAIGTAAITLLWGGYAAFLNNVNGGEMASAVTKLLGGTLNSVSLISAVGFIGGLVGGTSAMAGTYFRQLLNKN